MLRGLVLAALACVAFLVVPASASADATLVLTVNGIELTDASTEANQLVVTRAGTVITLDDSEPIVIDMAAQGTCIHGSDTTVVDCTFSASDAPTRLLQVLAGDGADAVTIQADNDADLDGGAGDDTLVGGPGADTVNGGEGSDTVSGGGGGDLLQDTGAAGFDTVKYVGDGEPRPNGVELTPDDGNATDGETGEGDDLRAGFETLWGSEGDDVITGTGDDEELFGDEGDDVLEGEGGDDVLGASAGADTFDGGTDAGGADVDTVRFARYLDNRGVRVTIDDTANDGVDGGAEGDDVRTTIEQVVGTEGDDTLTGSASGETLDGQNGNDTIEGLGGADTLVGYFGEDVLLARDGAADTVACGLVSQGTTSDGSDDVARVDGGATDTVHCATRDFGDTVDDKPEPTFANLRAVNGEDQSGTKITVLYGTLDAKGSEVTEFFFEYGPTAAYGSETPPQGVGPNPIEVNWSIPHVPEGSTLHYRLVAFRGDKAKLAWRSPAMTFTPGGGGSTGPAPAVVTGAATEVTSAGARLAGTVDPNGTETGYRFAYGTNPAELDGLTPEQSAGGGSEPVAVSATVTGLKPSTKYHFRLLGVRGGDFHPGDEASFTTAATTSGGSATTTTTTAAPAPPAPPAPPAQGPVVVQGNFIVTGPAQSSQQGIPTPDFRPDKTGKRWTLWSLDDARARLSGLGLNVDLTVKRVGDAGLPRALADDDAFERVLDANDVVGQSPTPDRAPVITNAVKGSGKPSFRLTVYDPSLDRRLDRALDAKGCAYERRDAVGEQLRESLVNLPLRSADRTGAADRLVKQGCTWELATVKGDIRATETTVNRAVAARVRRTGLQGRQEIVGLHVTEPRPEPPVFMAKPNANANNGAEIGLALSAGSAGSKMTFAQGRDGYELTAAKEDQSFRVTPFQRASGHLSPPDTLVELYYAADGEAGSGTFLGSKRTSGKLGVQFDDVRVDRKGKLIVKASYTGPAKDGSPNTLMGTREVPVVVRGCKSWRTVDGVPFEPVRVATGCYNYNRVKGAARAADFWDVFGPLAGPLRKIFTGSEQAADAGRTATGQPPAPAADPNQFRPCSADQPEQNAGSTPPAGLANAIVITPGGQQVKGQMPAVATAQGDACAINQHGILFDTAQMTKQLGSGAQVIRHTGGEQSPIQIFDQVRSVISTGGGNVISTGGGNLRAGAEKVAAVISTGGGNITADLIIALIQKPDGSLRTSYEIAQVISTGGGNVISTGGGNVISTGGGNVISTGGGNLIPGAKNVAGVIATGGGNLTLDQAAQVISTGGGNLKPDALGSVTVGVISTGGGNLKAGDLHAKVISTGGGNILSEKAMTSYFDAAALIGQAGGNLAVDPGRIMTAAVDSVVQTGSGNLAVGGAGLIGQAGGN